MKNLKNQIILIVVIACMLPCQVFAANATIGSYTYQNESEYAATMDEIVMPYINSIKSEGYITGSADAKLHYEKFINPSANDSIVIFHGISESSEKFYEFIYDLSVNNYNVYLMDHRGHGDSERFLDDPDKIDVDNWENFIADQKLFVENIVKPELKADSSLLLYAHSMGGLIGTTYLEDYPDDFDAAVINCPLYDYNIGVPSWIIRYGAKFMMLIGKGDDYAPGLGGFCEEVKLEYALSSSIDRMYYYNDQRVKDESQHTYSGTNHFYNETYEMMDNAVTKAKIQQISCPVLLVTGAKDGAVSVKKQNEVATYSDNITQVTFEDANHELYMERDEILAPYLEKVLEFFGEN